MLSCIIENNVIKEDEQIVFQQYVKTCSVTPKNIYTSKQDLHKRYQLEKCILNKLLDYFETKGFSRNDIINKIPEFKYYSLVNYAHNNIANDIINKVSFYDYLYKEINDFYSIINPREYGEYYTQFSIINLALKDFKINSNEKIMDPSCGSGFILYACLLEILKKEKDIDKIQKQIFGYDIFPFAVITTKMLLASALLEQGIQTIEIFNFKNIKIHNTLNYFKKYNIDKNIAKFDCIIGNPPYFRIDPKDNDKLNSKVSYGHNYAHSLFIQWSIEHLKKDGRFCLIVPESILSGFYYQKLRKSLYNNVNIESVILSNVHEDKFDVQQEIIILIANKSTKQEKTFSIARFDSSYRKIIKYPLPYNILQNEKYVIPAIKNQDEYKSIKIFSEQLKEIKTNHIQMATGNFVWNQNKKSCYSKKVDKSVPLISGTSIQNGNLCIDNDNANNYSYCVPTKICQMRNDTAIVFRRMSPMDYKKRFMGAIIDSNKIKKYVVENHVNILSMENIDELKILYNILNTEIANTVINIFCHTNQISTNDLRTIFEVSKLLAT